jgi:hypothetical protein
VKNIILQICGTSGSGKSTLMRAVMNEGKVTPRFTTGRKTPIGYDVIIKGAKPLFVLGSYENVAGGCDTIKTMDEVYDLVKREWSEGKSVAFEGLLASKNFGRGLELFKMAGNDMTIILLNTSLDECYASIATRRAAAGKEPRADKPKATANDKKGHDQYVYKMKQIDARVHKVSRQEAPAIALAALREK